MLSVEISAPGMIHNSILHPGQSGSLSDNGDTLTMLVFSCFEGHAELRRSNLGFHIEQGQDRIVHSTNYQLIKRLEPGDEYIQAFQAQFGPAELRLKLEP